MSGAEQYNIDDMPMEVMCDDLFDQIDDLLDFPNYYYEDNHFETLPGGEKWVGGAAAPAPPTPPPCKREEPVGADKPDAVLQFDDEADIAADLEWVSNFMDDTNETFSLKIPSSAVAVKKEIMERTASPNSVLNGSGGGGGDSAISSSSSSSSFSSYTSGGTYITCQVNPIVCAVPARARSKRPRPSGVTVRAIEEEFVGESITPPEKKIIIRIKNPQYTASGNCAEEIHAVRKCLHCEVTKTPQWRAGPMGPKTLCNACGVRYKSGRLFPEYRPAASPTFVPAVHSNSHKKVVEMRIQKPAAGMSSRGDCDLLNYIRRRD